MSCKLGHDLLRALDLAARTGVASQFSLPRPRSSAQLPVVLGRSNPVLGGISSMKRRDALRLIAGAAVLPVLSHDVLALGRELQQHLGASRALRTLDPHQDATIAAIAEMIIPATETPGARGARVDEFIDLVLTDWFDDEQRARFLHGIAATDARSRSLYGNDFVKCSQHQQVALLTALDEELAELREAEESGRRPKKTGAFKDAEETPVEQNFFHTMRFLTLIGYYTSEVGITQELGRPGIHMGPYQPCVPVDENSKVQS